MLRAPHVRRVLRNFLASAAPSVVGRLGWIQPSQSISTPTLSSSLSGFCFPTRCPASPLPKLHPLRSPLLRCSSSAFGTNSSASGLKKISHHHFPTQTIVHLPSCAGFLSIEDRTRRTIGEPSLVPMDPGLLRGGGRPSRGCCFVVWWIVLYHFHRRDIQYIEVA